MSGESRANAPILKSICGWFRISDDLFAETLESERMFVLFTNALRPQTSFRNVEFLVAVRASMPRSVLFSRKRQFSRLDLVAIGADDTTVISPILRNEPFFVCAHASSDSVASIRIGSVVYVRQNSTQPARAQVFGWPSSFQL